MNAWKNISAEDFVRAMKRLSRQDFLELMSKHYPYARDRNFGWRARRNTWMRNKLMEVHCGLAHDDCLVCKKIIWADKTKRITAKQLDRIWPLAVASGNEWLKMQVARKLDKNQLPRLMNETGLVMQIIEERLK